MLLDLTDGADTGSFYVQVGLDGSFCAVSVVVDDTGDDQ